MLSPRMRVQRADALCRLLTVVLPAEFGKGRPACADEDPELFFPFPEQTERIKEAKAVCARCPLVESCLAYALPRGDAGIWGGTTSDERAVLRRARRAGRGAA